MLGDTGHGEGVEHLEEERAHAADEHGRQVVVDEPGHTAGRQVGVVGIRGDRRRFLGDPDRPPHVACDVVPGGGRQLAHEAERGAGDGAAEAGGTLDWVQRAHAQSLARGRVHAVRFVVLGAGAIGGAVGARLHQKGFDVTLVARGEHGRALESGLVLEAPDETVTLPIPVVSDPALLAWDGDTVVLLSVKGQHTEHALNQLSVAPPSTPVVCMQNGVENERRALRHFPNTYGMCVMCPATQLRPGVVQLHSAPVSGMLDLGRYPAGIDDTGRAIADAIATTTFQSVARPDIMRWKYRKLLMNLANAVEALSGPEGRFSPLAQEAQREGKAVLAAAGIEVASSEEDRERRADHLQIVRTASGEWRGGSSWQSLARGAGSIEAEFLNGEIVLLGRLHGVPTPVNALLQRLAVRAAADAAAPGSWRIEDLSEQAGVRHGE